MMLQGIFLLALGNAIPTENAGNFVTILLLTFSIFMILAGAFTSYFGGHLDDMQFSSENGVVRPHARPYRYLISNLDIIPGETSVLTGIPGEIEVLRKLGFENIFFPELGELPNPDGAVTIHELADVSRFL